MSEDVLTPDETTENPAEELETREPLAPEEEVGTQDPPEEGEEQSKQRKGPTIDERIAKLKQQTAIMRAQERKLQERQAQIQQREEQLQNISQTPQLKEPDPDDYDDTNKYHEDWKVWYQATQEVQRPKQVQEEVQKVRMKERITQEKLKWEMKRDDALDPDSENHVPGLSKYLKAVDMTFQIHDTHPVIEQGIRKAKDPIKLIAYLGKNMDILEEIAQGSPEEGLMTLGAVQKELGAKPKTKTSRPPKPMEELPAANGGSAQPTTSLAKMAKMSYEEYEAARNKQEYGR